MRRSCFLALVCSALLGCRATLAVESPRVSLRLAWTHQAPQPPSPAWTAPAKWDAYANVRGLRAMRNYDAAFPFLVVGDSLYYASSVDDALHSLNVKSGRAQWHFNTDAPLRTEPFFENGRLYFGADDGCAYCINAKDGKLVWKFKPAHNEKRRILNNGRFISQWPCRTGVAVRDGVAYCAFSMLPWNASYLCALDAKTGKLEGDGCYVRKLSNHTLEGSIRVTKEGIVVTQGRVPPAVFQRSDGKPLGTLSGGGGSFLTVTDDGRVYHGPGNKTGWIIKSELATRKVIARHANRTAAVERGDVTYFLADNKLAALARGKRQLLWEVSANHPYDLIYADGLLYVGGDDETAAFRASDGKRIWSAPVQGRAHKLAMVNGSLIVSTDEGRIHCFRVDAKAKPIPVTPKSIMRSGEAPRAVKDADLLNRWVFHYGMNAFAKRRGLPDADRIVQDLAGKLHGKVLGKVQLQPVGGVEALALDGATNSVRIADDHSKVELPTTEITVEAWVRVDQAHEWGGIAGVVQDNGSFEKGWLLGYRQSQFSFAVNGKGGPNRLSYVRAATPFTLETWHHVVGVYDGVTQKIYVDGKLSAQATEQSGAIDYPPKAFFELGAYHDDNEYYRMNGLLHEVRVYKRALGDKEVLRHFQENARRFPRPMTLPFGPYAQFTGPSTATIVWSTDEPSPTSLELFLESDRIARHVDVKPKTEHRVELKGLRRPRVYHYVIATQSERTQGRTDRLELDTHFNYREPSVAASESPYPNDKSTELWTRAADEIVKRAPTSKGICLVLGCEDGRLIWELLKRTEMRIIGVDTDAKNVQSAREFLRRAGIYGARATVHHVDALDDLPFVGRFANLIVSDTTLRSGRPVGGVDEAYRVLRPNGGLLLLGQPGAKNNEVAKRLKAWAKRTEHRIDGNWLTIARGRLEGAGEWSHQYGRADNSAFGGETLSHVRGTDELQVQWIGRPGPRAQPDRSGRKPAPLSVNGRLFVQGLHRIIAVDAFNGTILWTFEIPALERFNVPRDCGNWCADDRFVYLVVRDRCWQIDAQMGKLVKLHPVPPGDRKEWSYDWGYVARQGDRLLGSTVKAGTAFTSYWGREGWHDARSGTSTHNVCSEQLFALDAATGKRQWSYAKGVILNATITATANRAFFIECRHPKVKASNARRVGTADLWKDQFLVALDLKTGGKIYERAIDTEDGTVLFHLAHGGGKLVVTSSSNKRFHVYALDAKTGKQAWQQSFSWVGGGDHGKAMSRPAIVGDKLMVRPRVLHLPTGAPLSQRMPNGGCGTYAATSDMLIFRSRNVTLWSASDNRVSAWNRLRPGCWLSTIPANGMLLSPEAGGGCSCGSWMETSIGFMPKSQK